MNREAAPLLGYEYVKNNFSIFSEDEEIKKKLRETDLELSTKQGCSNCFNAGIKMKFQTFIVNYLINNKRLDIFLKLPLNMVVPYGMFIYRVKEILEKSGRIT